MITFQQRLYLSFCNLLGAKIFKKYWPVGGSYWNENHVSQKSARDMKDIIRDANRYTRVHANIICIEIIVMLVGSMSGYMTPQKAFAYVPISIVIHGYAFLIHHYNRILAKHKLSLLSEEENMLYDFEYKLYINKVKMGFRLMYSYNQLSPTMKTKEECEEFKTFVEKTFSGSFLELEEYLFMNDCNSLYRDFYNSMHK